jgi:hypothetical protein
MKLSAALAIVFLGRHRQMADVFTACVFKLAALKLKRRANARWRLTRGAELDRTA